MPGAIVLGLNALAVTLVEHEPDRARNLLDESIERCRAGDEVIASEFTTGCLVTGLLRDWDRTLSLNARMMSLWRWSLAPLQVATSLAECARAFAEDRPEVAGVLRGAAYAAFQRASPAVGGTRPPATSTGPNANFLLAALRETGDIVADALGADKRRELRTAGAEMSMDEAVSYALANIDPRLSIDR